MNAHSSETRIEGEYSVPRMAGGVREAIASLALGVRGSLTLRAMASSLLLWVAAACLWGILFWILHDEMLQGAIGAAAVVVHGLAVLFPGLAAGSTGVAGGGLGMTVATVSSVAIGGLLAVLAYIVAVLLTVRVLAELFLMGWIRRQALEAYPWLSAQPPVASGGFSRAALGNWARPWAALIGLAPLCLLLPVVGGGLLFLLLSYLNVRFLVNDAMEDLASPEELRTFVRSSRVTLMALGMAATLLNFVPFFGLLIPWATGSAVCHLTMRHLVTLRAAPAGLET